LLLLMLAVIIAMTTVLVVALDTNSLETRRQVDARETLAQAREALLNYAVVQPYVAGGQSFGLPCPDINNSGGYLEGEAHTSNCGAEGQTVIGRLPWRTLGLPPLKDTGSECLWYVVSGSWKQAGASTAAMINPDSNGQLQLASVDTSAIVEGVVEANRPVAMVIAPMRPLSGQTRPSVTPATQCSPGFAASNFMEADAASGSNNFQLSGAADVVDVLGVAANANDMHNDRIVTITRHDVAERIYGRPGFANEMRDLGLAAAACLANYAAQNPGGANDLRLPWPAPVALTDYRQDAQYDDTASGLLSGRLADTVDDSNVATGNTINRVLSDCDTSLVPQWSAQMLLQWQTWKDHFFYAVAGSFAPNATVPSVCTDCLSVNGTGQYAAILMFANQRLQGSAQQRNAPPLDADTKQSSVNYLEGNNQANVPGSGTLVDYTSQAASATFNDRLFCIDAGLLVAEC
jgi:hypothetical protein